MRRLCCFSDLRDAGFCRSRASAGTTGGNYCERSARRRRQKAAGEDRGAACRREKPGTPRSADRRGIPGPGGLTAYAGIAQQQPLAIYLTPDSKHVIVGTMMDEEGTDVTQASLKQATIGAWTGQTWDALSESSWIADGSDSAKRIVYMFTDPNCPFCHKFWTQSRPWIKAGKVQVRHIMVGLLTESSPGKAAAILAADDPARALEVHESAGPENGIQPLGSIPDDVAIKLEQNRALMEQLQIQGTPGIFYFDAQGDLQIQRGAPLDEHLEEILGPR